MSIYVESNPDTEALDLNPQDAANTIEEAIRIGTDVADYSANRETYKPALKSLNVPSKLHPVVSEFAGFSKEQAALVYGDADTLNKLGKAWDNFTEGYSSAPKMTRMRDLTLKKMFDYDNISEDELNELDLLKYEINSSNVSTDLSDIVTTETGKQVGLMQKTIEENYGKIAAGGAIGSLTGVAATTAASVMGLGSVGGVPGLLVAGGALTVAGIGAAATMSFWKDEVKLNTAMTYNSLDEITTPDGKYLDEVTKRQIATGAGVVMGTVETIIGRATAKLVPGLKNFFGGGEYVKRVVSNPSAQAMTTALTDLGKAMTMQGVGEGGQEYVSVIAEELGRANGSWTEADFANAISQATIRINDLKAGTINAEGGKVTVNINDTLPIESRTGEAATVGALVTGTMMSPVAGLSYKMEQMNNVKAGTKEAEEVVQGKDKGVQVTEMLKTKLNKGIESLKFQNQLATIIGFDNASKVTQMTESTMNMLHEQFVEKSSLKYLFMDGQELQNAFTDEAKIKRIRQLMNLDESIVKDAPIQVSTIDFIRSVREFPELIDYAMKDENSDSPAKAKKFLDEYVKIQKKSESILESLRDENGNIDPVKAEQAMQELLGEIDIDDPQYDNVTDTSSYMERPIIPPEAQEAIGKAEYDKQMSARRAARFKRSQEIDKNLDDGYKKLQDIQFEEAMDAQIQNEYNAITEHRGIAIRNMFLPNIEMEPTQIGKRWVDDVKVSHQKKGYSAYAIDPRDPVTKKIRPELKPYVRNGRFKNMKVFVNGGLSLEESARLLGFSDPMMLIKTLNETPSKEELAVLRAKKHEYEIRKKVEQETSPTTEVIEMAYNEVAHNHLAELKFMLSDKWSALKGEIKRLALGIPKTETLIAEARATVRGLKISRLKPKVFEIAERRADRSAYGHFTKGDAYNMYREKVNAAKSVLMDKEMKIALKKVNRELRYVRNFFKDKDNLTMLKQAGAIYSDAAQAIVETFSFKVESKKEINARESFNKFAERMIEIGEGDFILPDRFLDQRKNVNDMTVDDVLILTDMLRKIVHKAEYKNRLLDKKKLKEEAQYIEDVRDNVVDITSKNPQFDPKKIVNDQLEPKWVKMMRDSGALLKRMEFEFQRLDGEGQVNGYMHQTFFQPLADAVATKSTDIAAVVNEMDKAISTYGKDDYLSINKNVFYIEDFKDTEGLNKGNVTKGQLLQMLLNFGNEGNIKRLENFGVNRKRLLEILQTHLEQRDIEFAQTVWDIIESLKPKVAELERMSNGTEPEWVEATPLTFKGKGMSSPMTVRGGYYRIIYNNEVGYSASFEILRGAGEKATLQEIVQQKWYAQAMTKQHHLNERMDGVTKLIDLNLANTNQILEEILHDVHFRLPVQNVAKLLSDKKIAESITSVSGRGVYDAMVQWVKDAANSSMDYARTQHGRTGVALLNRISGGQNVAILGMRLSVAMTQLVSIPAAVKKMGVMSGSKYVLAEMNRIIMNPLDFEAAVEFASQRYPDLKLALEGLDLDLDISLMKLSPSEYRNKVLNWTDLNTRVANDILFKLIGYSDTMARTVVFNAAYKQALEGEAKGVVAGDEKAAINYAASVARTSQTANNMIDKSNIQKNPYLSSLFAKFYSGLNIIHNLWLDTKNDLYNSEIEAQKILHQGHYSAEAVRAAFMKQTEGLGSVAASVILLGILPEIYMGILKGEAVPGSDDSDEDFMDFAVRAPMLSIASSTPGVNAIAFALESSGKKRLREVNVPITRTMTDVAYTAQALWVIRQNLVHDEGRELNDQQKRAMLNTLGVATKLVPSSAIWNGLKMMEENNLSTFNLSNNLEDLSKKMKTIIDDPKVPEELKVPAQQMLEIMQPEIVPVQPPTEEPAAKNEDYNSIIQEIESGGKWYAQNPKSSAAGLYQFTKSTWDWIMEQAPELELTDKGRINRDTTQQEAAFKWFTDFNAKQLQAAGIELNPENLYAAHFLGVKGAIEVLSQPDTYKLNSIVGERVMESNDFSSGMKVSDFKEWLKKKIEKGREEAAKKQAVKEVDNDIDLNKG